MIQVKTSKDLLTVKMAGRVITPAGNQFFCLLDRHFCILSLPSPPLPLPFSLPPLPLPFSSPFFFLNSAIVNKLRNLSLLGKSEIYH